MFNVAHRYRHLVSKKKHSVVCPECHFYSYECMAFESGPMKHTTQAYAYFVDTRVQQSEFAIKKKSIKIFQPY